MHSACYFQDMNSTFQIRNFPRDLKERLRRRARARRTTMSECALALIREGLERPSPEELLRRLRSLEPVEPGLPAAELLAEARREREDGPVRT